LILRSLATLVLVALLGLNWMLPTLEMSARGPDPQARTDFDSNLAIGKRLPPLELVGLDGRVYSRDDLEGHRVLLTFERSVDW
jgi:hypothetical protein